MKEEAPPTARSAPGHGIGSRARERCALSASRQRRSFDEIGGPMNDDGKRLLAIAKENPWWTFTIEELSAITGYSRDVVSAAKEHGARFPFGKSRPEWLMEWMSAHPRASLKNPEGV